MDRQKAFLMGFDYAISHHAEGITAEWVSNIHPDMSNDEIEAFLNGIEDSIKEDRARINMIKNK